MRSLDYFRHLGAVPEPVGSWKPSWSKDESKDLVLEGLHRGGLFKDLSIVEELQCNVV